MHKAVFRPNELITLPEKVVIESPSSFPDLVHLSSTEEDIEEIRDIDEYTGPTADDLRREAEIFKADWEEEKQKMISGAKAEAEKIIDEAQKAAFAQIQRKTDEGQVIIRQAQDEAERILTEGKTKITEIENEIRQTLDGERKDARTKGREEGREKGFGEGKAEVERLVHRTQVMLERAQDKRGEIISESEQEIIDLVLLIARKVVKVISENQRNVIVSNVVQALRKVKSRGNVIIRVDMSDLQLATEHKDEFIKLVEGVKSIQIIEDSTVDSGGCVIETDFGEIDARISSQLAELEKKILEISPIKTEMKKTSDDKRETVDRAPNLSADLAATGIMGALNTEEAPKKLSSAASAALTASAALAALASMDTKGRRQSDKLPIPPG